MNYQSLLERKLEPQGASGDEVVYICPNPECDDKSGHLYVNYMNNRWHCFKCGRGGYRLESLMKLANIAIDFDYSKIYNEADEELDNILSMRNTVLEKKEIVDYSTDLEVLTEYYNMHTSQLSSNAYSYLLSRGLTPSLIEKLQLREGVNLYGKVIRIRYKEFKGRDYSGRIMIPSLRRDGLISFYLCRDYTGNRNPKYINVPKELAIASEDVWNLDMIESNFVVICEGVFTSIAVNQALGKFVSVATYGKSISKRTKSDGVTATSQGEKLISRNFSQYIVFYDKDAKLEAMDTARYLHDRGANVRVVTIPEDMYGPKADAADMTREEVLKCIRDSEEFDEFLDILN